ncbi:MAG: outer membrane lipoprotein carrier protein LolA [Desulfurivibrionaceae bacterium]|nr:outer membrane lipoprotein carrier protein LolA [Desulfurivibrionaceae bacterium]
MRFQAENRAVLVRGLCLGLLLLLAAQPVMADPLADFIEAVEEKSEGLTSFSVPFVQERHLLLFDQVVVFKGELAISRPDKLRWAFLEPVPSVLIFNGRMGRRCNDQVAPETFDLDADPVMAMVAQQLWTWLDGRYAKLATRYDLALKEGTTLLVTPKEKDMAQFIEQVVITFDPRTLRPAMVEIIEPGGDMTRLRFGDYQPGPLPEHLFESCGQP